MFRGFGVVIVPGVGVEIGVRLEGVTRIGVVLNVAGGRRQRWGLV